MTDLWFILRIACILGCAFSGIHLTSARYRQWDQWNDKTKYHWEALAGWTFFGAYATVENIIQHNQGGSRLIVLALVIALTLRAILVDDEIKTKRFSSGKDPK